jgi:septin family protein
VSACDKVEVKKDRYVIGRKYSWGVCNIDNPEHSDFALLYNLLIGHFSLECIRLTEMFHSNYNESVKKKSKRAKKIQTERLKTLGTTALVVGIMSAAAIVFKDKLKSFFKPSK